MNILPFVTALLLVFGIMTYGKLRVFLSQNLVNQQIECYLKSAEIQIINQAQEELYDKHHKPSGPKDESPEIIKAARHLNFNVFIDKTLREQDPSRFQTIFLVTKRLIHNLYGQHPFFQKLQEKRGGDLADELLTAIIKTTEFLNPYELFREPIDLTEMTLGDEELQKLMITIFNGREDLIPLEECEKRSAQLKSAKKWQIYPKFSKFISIYYKNKKSEFLPLRLWLADEPVLMAVFDDLFFVKNTIQERWMLFNELSKFSGTELQENKKAFTNRFTALFEGKIPQELHPLVNFNVTTTVPPKPQ